MHSKNPELEIIILTYNSQFWLKKALLSCKEFVIEKSKKNIVVTVVDNNSEDDSISMLKKEFKWVSVIESGQNLGFAAGNNLALKKTTARYAMLVNSDIEFTEHSNLDILIDFMNKNSEVGIVTPRIEFTDGNLDAACHRGEPTPWVMASFVLGLEKIFPASKLFGGYHLGYKDFGTIHSIDACSGAGLLIRAELIKKIGLMDERYFMYAEDLDWCKQMRDAGYDIVYHPEVRVIHHKYKSGIKSSSQKIARQTKRHFYNTMLQYYDKHYRSQYPELVRMLIKYIVIFKLGAL
ncbi:MAG: glycosyltransferase family 2 protein [Microgenomates group bacterium]